MENLKEIRNFFNLTQDELAKKLMIKDQALIAQYESKATPSMKVLKKISEVFNLSIDFIALSTNCNYARNLKLLTLAQRFDVSAPSQSRGHVETTAEIFLKEKNITEIKQDSFEEDLTDNFHKNLKILRSRKDKSQEELASLLKVGRTTISSYERNIFPPLDNLIKLSECLDASMHALVTGQKLTFQFNDGPFGKTMLLADRLLPLEKQKYLIELMEDIVRK
jgi:transcriptional regulator with XRE-family HTH domain